MSSKQDLLVDAVLRRLSRAPSRTLGDLTSELRVSRRTLQNAIKTITGKTFREVRNEALVERVKTVIETQPTQAIKALSFELGYKSPRSFARAVKRACGCCPAKLRSRIIHELVHLDSALV